MNKITLRAKAAVSVMALIILQGCASMTHYNKSQPMNFRSYPGQVVTSLDAKQRVVLSNHTRDGIAACAEPSPDALSALAATQEGSFGNGSVNAGLNASLQEQAASIGLRTQSIQLMRDAMYRLCEGYLSNSLDPMSFETLHRRFQNTMVAILAIEQLTGTVKASQITLSPGTPPAGTASVTERVSDGQAVASVAAAVDKIVDRTISLGFGREFCATILINVMRQNPHQRALLPLERQCMDYLGTNVVRRNAETDLIRTQTRLLEAFLARNPSTQEILNFLRLADLDAGSGTEPFTSYPATPAPTYTAPAYRNDGSGYTYYYPQNSGSRQTQEMTPERR